MTTPRNYNAVKYISKGKKEHTVHPKPDKEIKSMNLTFKRSLMPDNSKL